MSTGVGLRKIKILLGCLAVVAASLCRAAPASDPTAPQAKLVEVRKIWDQAPHNAFTDIVLPQLDIEWI